MAGKQLILSTLEVSVRRASSTLNPWSAKDVSKAVFREGWFGVADFLSWACFDVTLDESGETLLSFLCETEGVILTGSTFEGGVSCFGGLDWEICTEFNSTGFVAVVELDNIDG